METPIAQTALSIFPQPLGVKLFIFTKNEGDDLQTKAIDYLRQHFDIKINKAAPQMGLCCVAQITPKPDENVHPNNLKNWDFDRAKAPGSDLLKRPPYCNMEGVSKVESRELSLRPKTNSSSCLGVKLLYTPNDKLLIEKYENEAIPISCLDGKDILTRPLKIEITNEKDIELAIPFQIEPHLPYPIEDAIIARITKKKSEGTTELRLLATEKEALLNHINQITQLGFSPEVVEAAPSALAHFAREFITGIDHLMVLNIGWEESLLITLDEGHLSTSQTELVGLCTLFDRFAEGESPTLERLHHFYHAQPDKNTIQELTLPLIKLILSQTNEEDKPSLLITGLGTRFPQITKQLKQEVAAKSIEISLPQHLNLTLEETYEFALPIGSALSVLPGRSDPVNFRQGPFRYPNPWKRTLPYLKPFFGALVLFTLSIWCLMGTIISRTEQNVRQQLSTLTQENQQSTSIQEIEKTLLAYQRALENKPKPFALNPNLPFPSEVLAWLNQETLSRKLNLISFHYAMMRFPTIRKARDRYQARIDLEFNAETPTEAREFHDLLLAPNPLIDPKQEIKWSVEKNKYKATFFLRDQTFYPSETMLK